MKSIDVIKRFVLNKEEKLIDILAYLQPHTDQMWAAKIASIILECDFRDAKKEVDDIFNKEF